MFPLTHVCHLSPPEIDALAFRDFIVLTAIAEAYLEADAKRPRM